MKTTDTFKNIISAHLRTVAGSDALFAESLKKPAKNIDDCVTYILNQVKKSGCNGFADEEVFQMAVHYYDEDDINVGTPVNATVVVNQSLPATKTVPTGKDSWEADKAPKRAKTKHNSENQLSLF